MADLSKEEMTELAELAEFRRWKEDQAVENVNDSIKNRGNDSTPFHYQDGAENYVVGNVEDINEKKIAYLLTFEVKKGEKINLPEVNYEAIDEDTELASVFIQTYPNAKNAEALLAVAIGLITIQQRYDELKADSSFGKVSEFMDSFTDIEKSNLREAAKIIFGISEELAGKMDNFSAYIAVANFLTDHPELFNEADGLMRNAKKLELYNKMMDR